MNQQSRQQLRLFVDRILHDRYKILNELGQGGMGAVYEAIDLSNNRHVAIKQTLPSDPNLKAALVREAALLASLDYPQLPHLLDQFEKETGMFFVMQFVSGPTLGQLLATRQLPFTPNQVKLWAKDILHTLSYLHGHAPGIIHQDIKPGNLKLLPDGSVFLLAFGLAKTLDGSADDFSDALLAYTPNYAPPEQIIGDQTGPRSDIYALGATLYPLLTGRPPADSLKRASQLRASGSDPLEPIQNIIRGVPQALSLLLTKALALDPQQRPSSAAEMIHQLQTNTLAPSFMNSRTEPQADPETVLKPKQAVLSGHHSRIAIQIERPDFANERVVSLGAYKEKNENAGQRLRTTASKLANLASAIAILFTVASPSTYTYRAVYSLEAPETAAHQEFVNEARRVRRSTLNPFEAAYDATHGLPPSANVDDVIRWRSRISKRVRQTANNRTYSHAASPGPRQVLLPATPATITF